MEIPWDVSRTVTHTFLFDSRAGTGDDHSRFEVIVNPPLKYVLGVKVLDAAIVPTDPDVTYAVLRIPELENHVPDRVYPSIGGSIALVPTDSQKALPAVFRTCTAPRISRLTISFENYDGSPCSTTVPTHVYMNVVTQW